MNLVLTRNFLKGGPGSLQAFDKLCERLGVGSADFERINNNTIKVEGKLYKNFDAILTPDACDDVAQRLVEFYGWDEEDAHKAGHSHA